MSIMENHLINYLNSIHLSNSSILDHGDVSNGFIKINILSLYDAIQYVYQLPYGRTSDRANYSRVLIEKRGACSTKHALIAALSEELSVPLHLMVGIFFMTPDNTPKIIPILERYNLPTIPEAHCFLKYKNATLDITFSEKIHFSVEDKLEQEIRITPSEIGQFKIEAHKKFIGEWLKDKFYSFDLVWAAREEYIDSL